MCIELAPYCVTSGLPISNVNFGTGPVQLAQFFVAGQATISHVKLPLGLCAHCDAMGLRAPLGFGLLTHTSGESNSRVDRSTHPGFTK